MTIVLGGSSGITWADTSNTAKANVSVITSSGISSANNGILIGSGVKISGSTGIYYNGNLYSTNRLTFNITISSDTSNYTLNTAKIAGYIAGISDIVLTINSGVTVYSGSTGTAALIVDTSWNAADTVTIVNNGTILGKGGNGGAGTQYGGASGASSSGGLALQVLRATNINNTNRIAGGGGGGGGGSLASGGDGATYGYGGGGGGGIGNGTGGVAPYAVAGSNGTLLSAGGGGGGSTSSTYYPPSESSGGYNINAYGGPGGAGGSFGSSGVSGTNGSPYGGYPATSGSPAGAAVSGNSNITWIATGTRDGAIS